MTKGRVIKNYNGYYYVDVGREGLIECRRRGKLLKAKILVGDELEITELGQDKGVIEALLPRRNQIRRPAVANIDQLLVIMAAKSPDPNQFLVDKMLMTCEYGGIHPTLCFNKCDLDRETAEVYKAFYERCGYDVYLVSAKTGEGLDTLRSLLPHRMTAFAGPSGVGKSSLLSQILGRIRVQRLFPVHQLDCSGFLFHQEVGVVQFRVHAALIAGVVPAVLNPLPALVQQPANPVLYIRRAQLRIPIGGEHLLTLLQNGADGGLRFN